MKKKSKKSSSRPVLRFVLWTGVFLLLLAATDQLLLRFSAERPLFRDFQVCYRDFRCRLVGGACRLPPRTVESAIEQETGQVVRAAVHSYLYVDREGTLQFADSLEEVPPAYRGEAQPLTE